MGQFIKIECLIWDRENYIFAQKWLRWGLKLIGHRIALRGPYIHTYTYTANFNPSTPTPPPCVVNAL